ncbi:MAG: hypothetical protein ACJATT_003627 [Myxococcota bacterium]
MSRQVNPPASVRPSGLVRYRGGLDSRVASRLKNLEGAGGVALNHHWRADHSAVHDDGDLLSNGVCGQRCVGVRTGVGQDHSDNRKEVVDTQFCGLHRGTRDRNGCHDTDRDGILDANVGCPTPPPGNPQWL